ncbi:hypothetical protein BGZ95_007765, partial [Linnemannia exigua]
MRLGSANLGQKEALKLELSAIMDQRDKLSVRAKELKSVIADLVNIMDNNPHNSEATAAASHVDSPANAIHSRSSNGIRIKIPAEWPTYSRRGTMTAYHFFDAFIRTVVPVLEKNTFEREGHTYLTLLVKDDSVQDLLLAAFKKLYVPGTIITEDFLERVFFDTCLTKDERAKAVDELLKIGRKKTETYQLFSARILQIMRRLHIDGNDNMTLNVVKNCLPAETLNMVRRAHNEMMLSQNKPIGKPNTIEEFCAALGELEGPDTARDSDPAERGGMSASKNTNQFCETCNKETNHSTNEHVNCEYCRKAGHTDKECHTRKRDEERRRTGGRNNSDRRPHDRNHSSRDRNHNSRDRSPRRDDRNKDHD